MILIIIESQGCELEIVDDSGIDSDGHARLRDLSPLSVDIYRKTFVLVKDILN